MNNANRTKGEHNAEKHTYTQWLPAQTPWMPAQGGREYCHENAVQISYEQPFRRDYIMGSFCILTFCKMWSDQYIISSHNRILYQSSCCSALTSHTHCNSLLAQQPWAVGTRRSLTWWSIFVYLLWISMAPSVHHDWPTFENHIHTYKRHATRNTHTYNDSHLFRPFVDCSCNAGQTHRCVTVQVFKFHITSSSTIHPFQVPSFSSFTSVVPRVLVPLSFYVPCCLKEVWDTLSVHFYLFMSPSLLSSLITKQ